MRRPARLTPRLERLDDRIAPATFTVTNANNAGSGSLRQAVLDANAAPGADLVDFSTYFNVPRTISLASTIAITGPVTIGGTSAANVTVSGNGTFGIFNAAAAPAGTAIALVDLTLRRGFAEYGGAVSVVDEALSLTRCVLTASTANAGGAVAVYGPGSLTATDCDFLSNFASSGGAILVGDTNAATTLTRCQIAGNAAFSAGGLSAVGSLLLDACTISGNSAVGVQGQYGYYPGYAGGVAATGSATIRNSTISGNGGGVYGGVYGGIPGQTLLVQNSTIVDNVASHGPAGGITGSFVTLESSIVARNAGAIGAGDISAYTVTARNSAVPVRDGITVFNDLGGNRPAGEDPRLGPLQDNGGPTRTHLLLPNSPCLNAGSNPANLTTDQRGPGFPRVLSGATDMGAAEGVDVNPTATATGIPATVTAGGGTSFTVVVRYDDDAGIDLATLDLSDITVTGPGYAVPQTPTARTVVGAGAVVTVTYTLPAPGGSFDFGDDGLYTVAVAANQVKDTDTPTPHFVAAGTLGTIRVAVPGTLVVDEPTDIDDGNTTAGHLSLREAVRLTNAALFTADTITFSPAVFATPRTVTVTGALLTVADSLAIVGPGAGLLTLNSAGPTQVLYAYVAAPGVALSVSGLTVSNAFGGGIYCGMGLTLTDIAVTNCLTVGVSVNGSLTMRNGTITNNQGKGLHVSGPLTVRDSTVSNNRVLAGPYAAGGGIFAVNGPVLIERCSIAGNQAAGFGGGLFVATNGTVQISDSTFSGNQSNLQAGGLGGGGMCINGTLAPGSFLRNCTISGNVAASGSLGGGLGLYFYGTLAIANSTITGNSTTGPGGGIGGYCSYALSEISLNSTIVAGNSGGSIPDLYYNATFPIPVTGNNNLVGVANASNFTLTGTGNLTGTAFTPLNPLLAPLADNGGPTRTHALLAGSPALNAGNNAAGLTADQRGPGFVRVSGSAADIGAFEAQPSTPRVQAVAINGGVAQRSRVTSLTVTFTAPVTFAGTVADAFTVSRIGGGAVGSFTATAAVVNGVTVVTLSNFAGAETEFGSLADGRYRLTVRAAQVTLGGQPLDGNGDGLGGDDYALDGSAANGLYRLYGDVDGDGFVNAADFLQFRGAFGSSPGQAAYLDYLDLDGDGVINAFDFAQLRSRFGAGVP